MKLTVIGGGSTYTPELVDGIARSSALAVDEVVLHDPDQHRLDLVGGVCARMLAREGRSSTLRTTTDLDDAVDGADVVLIQLRIGGQAARLVDETFPLPCGCIGQETTGAGGLAKALRTVPVVLDVADRVRRLAAPGAWIIDFTNPVGIVTRALLDAGHRAVGLCNVAIGFQRWFAELLAVEPGRVQLDHVGLNHLSWERAVLLDGVDVLPRLLAGHGQAIAERIELPADVVRLLGTVPSYYLRYFYAHDAVVREQLTGPPRAARVAEIERDLLELYADPALNTKPRLLTERGGAFYSEAALDLVTSLLSDVGDVQVADVRNNGTLPFLPDDAVIEAPARITAAGAEALALSGPIDPLYAGLIAHTAGYEELALDAALRGGRDRVFRALLAHPLIGQLEQADRLALNLIAENKAYLAWA
jgi:6-phospho-beta-glucosidase